MDYAIATRDGYLEAVLSGPARLRSFREFLDSAIGHASWTPGLAILLDQTGLDTATLTVAEVRRISDLCIDRREEIGAGKLALLVARDLEYGMGRMWGAFVEDRWSRAVSLFRRREDAVAWLIA